MVELPRPGALTGREVEVLELITQGYTNREIADRLYLSVNTVKTHVRAGYRKIGATRRVEAVRWESTIGAAHTSTTSRPKTTRGKKPAGKRRD